MATRLRCPPESWAGIPVAEAGQAQERQPVLGPFVGLGRRQFPDAQAEGHVVAHGAPREQGVVLKEEADVARTDVELDPPAERVEEAGDHAQDAGLARSGRADERGELPRRHVEVDAVENRLAPEADGEPRYAQHGRGRAPYPARASASSRRSRSTCPGRRSPATSWTRATRAAASTSTPTRSGYSDSR